MTTTKAPERLRRFDRGGPEIEVPVDALGRMRFRATLDEHTVTRAEDDEDTTRRFRGHAVVFNKRTWIGGRSFGFWEEIAPGSTAKTIREADIRFLINHDPSLLLARNKAGTLTLAEDKVGLRTDASLDTRQTYTSDLVVGMERGDINQMSFAFEPVAWERTEAEDGKTLIRLTEMRLFDVSVVTFPAYTDTDAGLRGAAFDAMTRSLGLDQAEVLERMDAPDLGAYLAQQIASRHTGGAPGPAETTQATSSGPPESTRTDTSPPAETTGTTRTKAGRRRLKLATRTADMEGRL